MNKILTFISALAISLTFSSCEKPQESAREEYLEVTAHNLSGCWKLKEWNGASLAEGTYLYIEFIRNDRSFVMYQNVDSYKDTPHILTGHFNIDTDPELGAIIRGQYDYDSGDWKSRFVVRNLTEKEMTWLDKSKLDDIQVFEKMDSIPNYVKK